MNDAQTLGKASGEGYTYTPPVEHVMQFFTWAHLPPHLQDISRQCAALAVEMATTLPSNPELTVGLRKLLEAKDAFVRAQLAKG